MATYRSKRADDRGSDTETAGLLVAVVILLVAAAGLIGWAAW